MAEMTNEQLVSFINYQIGQKQGWESLGRVIGLVNDADTIVRLAKEQADLYQKHVDEMKQSLATLEQTRSAKQGDLDLQASTKRNKMLQEALGEVEQAKTRQVALQGDLVQLDKQVATQAAVVEKLQAQIVGLQRQKVVAEGDLVTVQKRIAEIKASL